MDSLNLSRSPVYRADLADLEAVPVGEWLVVRADKGKEECSVVRREVVSEDKGKIRISTDHFPSDHRGSSWFTILASKNAGVTRFLREPSPSLDG